MIKSFTKNVNQSHVAIRNEHGFKSQDLIIQAYYHYNDRWWMAEITKIIIFGAIVDVDVKVPGATQRIEATPVKIIIMGND